MNSAYISILGLYNYDNSIFDNLELPEVLEDSPTLVTDNLLMELAELEVIYPDCDAMKFAIGRWSAARVQAWEWMARVLYEDYDPFINIKRDERRITTETRDLLGSDYSTETHDLTFANDRTVTLSTNAWDSDAGTERQSEVTDNDTTDTGTITNAKSSTDTGTITREEHFHVEGDSAIRDRQDIVQMEVDNRIKYNLINIIIEEFKRRFCIMVY